MLVKYGILLSPVKHRICVNTYRMEISAANDWQVYLCDDPNHFIWFCETQLNYLNAVNNLSPDKKYLVSGGTGADLWCEERIELGIRYECVFLHWSVYIMKTLIKC